jgi:hypothetical protein
VAQLTCLYCFAELTRRKLEFRCVGGGGGRLAGCLPELDDRYARYLGSQAGAVLPPVFAANGRKPHAVHDQCGQQSRRRVCPQCHNELPGEYCDSPSRIVALVGAKGSGKSTYIGVLIHELRGPLGRELDVSLNACDDRTARRYRRDFESWLYGQREAVPVTQSAETELHEPLIYRLTARRRRGPFGTRHRSLTLVLFDTAGEDMRSSDKVDRYLPYLGAADAIVFLVDPLELPGADRDILPEARSAQEEEPPADDPLDVIRRVTSLLRAKLARPASKRLPQAVAVAVTKIDALRPAIAQHSPLHQGRPRTGQLDRTDRALVDEQVRSLLERWGAGSLDRQLASDYRSHGLFALSALGHIPQDKVIDPAGITPYRVEDPLLWLLRRFHMISASKG